MKPVLSTLAALVASSAIASCAVEVDLEDKACPCGDGYECDPFGSTCVPELCAVSADELVVAWATPHTIAYEWGPSGDSGDFHQYELVIATSEEAARSGLGARVHGLAQNPALASLNTNGEKPMLTVVGDLTPGTEYFARLRITDKNACLSRSAVLAETTPQIPPKPIVLFDEPDGVAVQPERAELIGSGVAAYVEYDLASDELCTGVGSDGECGQPVKLDFPGRIIGEESGQTNLVEADEFDSAYVEVVIWYESPRPADTAIVFLSPEGAPQIGDFRFDLESFSLEPSSAYHSIEVPLRRLRASKDEGRGLTHADLMELPFNQAAIGGQWDADSVVRIDAIRIQHGD